MLNRRNFLGTLIQREYGEANAVSPRLPSRYEPIERSGAVAAFEETEPAPANREANAPHARHPDSRQHSPERPDTGPLDAESIQSQPNDTWEAPDEGMLVEHVGKTRPAASVATQRETADPVPGRGSAADIGPASDAVKSVVAEPGREVKSGEPSNPRTEEPDRIGSSLKQHGDEQRHTGPAAPAPSIAAPAEEPGQNLRPVMAEHVSGTAPMPRTAPHPEFPFKHGQPTRRNAPSSPDSDEEEAAATEPSHATKSRRANRSEIDSVDGTESVPDHYQHDSLRAIDPVAKPATGVVPTPTAVGLERTPQRPALPDMAATTIAISARNNNHPLDAPRAGDGASEEERNSRNSRIAPAPRVEASARVRVTKTGDIAPFSLRPEASEPPRRQPNMPPPLEPTINVTIGRIEVRAVTAPATPRRNNIGPKPMSLSEYLSRHSGNSNRRGTQ